MARNMLNKLIIRPHNKLMTVRPGPPTVKREWIGFLGFFLLLVAIDRFSTYVFYLSAAGLIYWAAIVFVACWAGLRSALASCLVLIVYAWLIFHFHFSAFGKDPSKADSSIISTAIFYPSVAIIAGIVQNKLRLSAIREFDARKAADEEFEQRRITEAELWASEEIRKLIIDSSVDAIIGIGSDGTITLWNPNAERLFGWTKTEALGRNLDETLILPGDRPDHADGIERTHALSGAAPRTPIEVVARTKNGTSISVELYVADHRTESGSLHLAYVRDISERKRSELAIQELNARLEDRVAERTAQLEAANAELVGFTYSVSHDLRAPLRAIVANSRIVREDTAGMLDSESSERLQRLEANALKMAELIENLLQFARIGQVAPQLQAVDLTEMAKTIAHEVDPGGVGTFNIHSEMRAKGDAEMLHLVLFNLIENAWKYVKPGEKPNIEVGQIADGTFYVKDEGIGFDMKYVEKVWEPFERLHRDSDYPGTGIGLANAKRIISRHGGRMWAESTPEVGTTMYFTINQPIPVKKSRVKVAAN